MRYKVHGIPSSPSAIIREAVQAEIHVLLTILLITPRLDPNSSHDKLQRASGFYWYIYHSFTTQIRIYRIQICPWNARPGEKKKNIFFSQGIVWYLIYLSTLLCSPLRFGRAGLCTRTFDYCSIDGLFYPQLNITRDHYNQPQWLQEQSWNSFVHS